MTRRQRLRHWNRVGSRIRKLHGEAAFMNTVRITKYLRFDGSRKPRRGRFQRDRAWRKRLEKNCWQAVDAKVQRP